MRPCVVSVGNAVSRGAPLLIEVQVARVILAARPFEFVASAPARDPPTST